MKPAATRIACVVASIVVAHSASTFAATTFLNHFDTAAPNGGAGSADFAAGAPEQQAALPFGFGGQIVSSPAKFGSSLQRTDGGTIGGRVKYNIANNWDVNKGTVEMWVYGNGVTGGGFVGLMGSDTASGNADVRMYIYDVGGVRTLGAYQQNGGGSFWEIEQAIPAALATSDQWHHVAWAYDTAAGKTATWWDGQLLRNTPDSGTVNPRTSMTNTLFHVGENQAGSGTFPGYIDEFRISNSVVYDMNSNFTPPSAPFAVPEPATLASVASVALLARRRRPILAFGTDASRSPASAFESHTS